MKKTLSKVLNIAIDILVVLVLIVSVLVLTMALTSKSQGVPSIFGYAPLTVESRSMSGTFEEGDLIICKVTDPEDEFVKGDVVTFPMEVDGISTFNTHRIVEVIDSESVKYYETKGDNDLTNPSPDETLQTSSTIIAKFTGTVIPGAGKVLNFLKSSTGFFLCILLPMIIFFLYQLVRFILNYAAYKQEKKSEMAVELTEDQKKKAVEEYLASKEREEEIKRKAVEEYLAQQAETNSSSEDNS